MAPPGLSSPAPARNTTQGETGRAETRGETRICARIFPPPSSTPARAVINLNTTFSSQAAAEVGRRVMRDARAKMGGFSFPRYEAGGRRPRRWNFFRVENAHQQNVKKHRLCETRIHVAKHAPRPRPARRHPRLLPCLTPSGARRAPAHARRLRRRRHAAPPQPECGLRLTSLGRGRKMCPPRDPWTLHHTQGQPGQVPGFVILTVLPGLTYPDIHILTAEHIGKHLLRSTDWQSLSFRMSQLPPVAPVPGPFFSHNSPASFKIH